VSDFDELRAAYYCAAEVLRTRNLSGQPIPLWLRRHYAKLDTGIRSMSESGHESDCDSTQLETDGLITAREAAVMLGRSKRQVQRIAADLGGQNIAGRWLFNPAAVREYAEEMRHHG